MITEQQHINEKRGILMASSGIWVTGPGFPRENLLHNTQRTQKRLWDGTGAALSPTQTPWQWIRLSAINEVSLARTVHPTVAAVTLRFFFSERSGVMCFKSYESQWKASISCIHAFVYQLLPFKPNCQISFPIIYPSWDPTLTKTRRRAPFSCFIKCNLWFPPSFRASLRGSVSFPLFTH